MLVLEVQVVLLQVLQVVLLLLRLAFLHTWLVLSHMPGLVPFHLLELVVMLRVQVVFPRLVVLGQVLVSSHILLLLLLMMMMMKLLPKQPQANVFFLQIRIKQMLFFNQDPSSHIQNVTLFVPHLPLSYD